MKALVVGKGPSYTDYVNHGDFEYHNDFKPKTQKKQWLWGLEQQLPQFDALGTDILECVKE